MPTEEHSTHYKEHFSIYVTQLKVVILRHLIIFLCILANIITEEIFGQMCQNTIQLQNNEKPNRLQIIYNTHSEFLT